MFWTPAFGRPPLDARLWTPAFGRPPGAGVLGFCTSSAFALSILTNANYKLQAIRQRYRLVAYAGTRADYIAADSHHTIVHVAIATERARKTTYISLVVLRKIVISVRWFVVTLASPSFLLELPMLCRCFGLQATQLTFTLVHTHTRNHFDQLTRMLTDDGALEH
jgi:hypothetical protein